MFSWNYKRIHHFWRVYWFYIIEAKNELLTDFQCQKNHGCDIKNENFIKWQSSSVYQCNLQKIELRQKNQNVKRWKHSRKSKWRYREKTLQSVFQTNHRKSKFYTKKALYFEILESGSDEVENVRKHRYFSINATGKEKINFWP